MPTVKLEYYYAQQEKLNKARDWKWLWKKVAKKFRDAYLGLSDSWDYLWDRYFNTRCWSHIWKHSAKKFRAMFLEVSAEWEDERDRYQGMMKERDHYIKLWDNSLKREDRLHELSDGFSDQRDEARRWAIDYGKRANTLEDRLTLNQLAIAARNTRIRELLERNKRLIAVCENTRTAILGYVSLDDVTKALSDHIAREESNE